MLGSMFFAVCEGLFPMKLNNTNVTSQLLNTFYEIKDHYGAAMTAELEFNVLSNDGNFISINKSAGFEVGKQSKAQLQLMVYASNETVKNELAVQFLMDLQAVANLTEDNYYIYLNIPEVAFQNVTIEKDNVGMYPRDYDSLLNVLAQIAIAGINNQWLTPYDFRTINPEIMFFITTVFSKPRISPFYLDQFIYLGLSYQFDFMSLGMTHTDKKHLETRIVNEEHAKLTQFYNIMMDQYTSFVTYIEERKAAKNPALIVVQ